MGKLLAFGNIETDKTNYSHKTTTFLKDVDTEKVLVHN